MRRASGNGGGIGLPALLRRLGLWLAAFALLSQSFALAAPPMSGVGDARAAAQDLAALFGQDIVVCAQADDSAPGPHSGDCRDSCPLCQVVANAAALDAPTTPALAEPASTLAARLAAANDPAPAPVRVAAAFARGPPTQT